MRFRGRQGARAGAVDAAFHGLIVACSSCVAFLTQGSASGRHLRHSSLPAGSSPGLTKRQQIVALLSGLIPAVCLHTWRAAAAHRRRNRLLRRLQEPLAVVDTLLAEASASSAQPLYGPAAAFLKDAISESLSTTHPLAVHLRPGAPPPSRAAALLACRVEALCRVKAAAAMPTPAMPPATPQLMAAEAETTHWFSPVTPCSSAGSCSSATAACGPAPFDDNAACKVCFERPCDALLAPCGHLAACLECLAHMQRTNAETRAGGEQRAYLAPPPMLRCPLCVAPVADVLRAFAC